MLQSKVIYLLFGVKKRFCIYTFVYVFRIRLSKLIFLSNLSLSFVGNISNAVFLLHSYAFCCFFTYFFAYPRSHTHTCRPLLPPPHNTERTTTSTLDSSLAIFEPRKCEHPPHGTTADVYHVWKKEKERRWMNTHVVRFLGLHQKVRVEFEMSCIYRGASVTWRWSE